MAFDFDTGELFVFALEAAVAVAVVFFAWPWGRRNNRFAVGAAATLLGALAWNLTLRHTGASGFDVDAPVIRLSWQDAGTGVVVFLFAALALGLFAEPTEQARRVVGAAALAGIVAAVLDIFLF